MVVTETEPLPRDRDRSIPPPNGARTRTQSVRYLSGDVQHHRRAFRNSGIVFGRRRDRIGTDGPVSDDADRRDAGSGADPSGRAFRKGRSRRDRCCSDRISPRSIASERNREDALSSALYQNATPELLTGVPTSSGHRRRGTDEPVVRSRLTEKRRSSDRPTTMARSERPSRLDGIAFGVRRRRRSPRVGNDRSTPVGASGPVSRRRVWAHSRTPDS